MPFNTFSVATAVTPSVIETYLSHYFNRGPLRQKPTAHISYHEGLRLIRRFLEYASLHTIEDIQGFTAQWVPAPTWCRIQSCEIPPQFLDRSAKVLRSQLGSLGVRLVGGEKWWQWRRPETPLHAEWIEMKKDFNERKRAGLKCDRVILYVHGGAYYFGSVDEHRYQMQRHARKLKARVLAPRYRLSPQFPFPCGLHDCIATYFYLLEHFPPNQILFAGDSAGGGMVISMLVTLRDQGLPLPAGAMLLSPWVDLTHSFPSVAGEGLLDYIPPAGFHHKPSLAWPPPPTEPMQRKFTQPIEQAFDVVELPAANDLDLRSPIHGSIDSENASMMSKKKKTPAPMNRNMTPGLGDKIEIEIDGKKVLITEQIQMYAKNELLAHPLVSPVQQPSLGGLPPLLIQVGGGEILRDEQIYLAHKAADPKNYPPCDAILDDYDPRRMTLKRYPPTNVQLQVWEDLCHVPHTLSFTRPAKHMYRSVAQFGAWALAHAQNKSIDIPDDDAISVISTQSTNSNASKRNVRVGTFGSIGDDGVTSTQLVLESIGAVGRAGDELPPFEDNMIRQRVNRHGLIFPLPHQSEIASLHLDPATIGAIKPGPVRKWLAKRAEMDKKFEKEYKKVQKKREKEAALGYDPIEEGEEPPLTALYRRRKRGTGPEEKKKDKKGWGLALWSGWGSSHDEDTLDREQKFVEERAAEATRLANGGSDDRSDLRTLNGGVSRTNLAVPGHDNDATSLRKARRTSAASKISNAASNRERETPPSRGPHTVVSDAGQADSPSSSRNPQPKGSGFGASWNLSRKSSAASGSGRAERPNSIAAPIPVSTLAESSSRVPNMSDTNKEAVLVPGSENTYINPSSSRPHNNFVAYPFKLRKPDGSDSPNPSTMTLDSADHMGRSELPAGGGPAAIELPTGVEASMESQEDTVASATSAFAPESLIPALVSPEPEAAFPSPMSERRTSIFHEESLNGSPRSREAVSPMNDSTLLKATTRSKYESRDSRLGNLGADGMPIAAFPGSSSRGVPPTAKIPAEREDESAKSAPFKLRNPVQDARSDRQGSVASVTATAASSAPFRLRNGSYDAQDDGSEADLYTNTTIPARRESLKPHPSYSLPIRSSSSKPPGNDTKAPDATSSTHMVIPPSMVSARRLTSDSDVPPTPPPKDISMSEQSSGKRPITAKSSTSSAPRLANLGFESSNGSSFLSERPPLETFVTARENFDPAQSKRSASGAPQL